MQTLIESRQKLEAQLQENLIVEDEFKGAKSETKVYKLTGPVLVPQSLDEAKSNVEKRLEFIRGQITQVEAEVDTLRKSSDEKRDLVSTKKGPCITTSLCNPLTQLLALRAKLQAPPS